MTTPPNQDSANPRRGLRWVLGALAVLATLGIGAIAVAATTGNGDAPAAKKAPSAWELEQARRTPAASTPEATTAAPSATPAASDIQLTAKITRKKCFGSAGCNLDFKVEMAYSGPTLSESDTWEITYEVAGVEDGPMIGSLELTGTTFTATEESVSTSSSKKKLTIKVTGVDKVGI